MSMSMNWLLFIVQHMHNGGHVATSCEGFDLLLTTFQADESTDFVQWCLIAALLNEIDQLFPISLR